MHTLSILDTDGGAIRKIVPEEQEHMDHWIILCRGKYWLKLDW